MKRFNLDDFSVPNRQKPAALLDRKKKSASFQSRRRSDSSSKREAPEFTSPETSPEISPEQVETESPKVADKSVSKPAAESKPKAKAKPKTQAKTQAKTKVKPQAKPRPTKASTVKPKANTAPAVRKKAASAPKTPAGERVTAAKPADAAIPPVAPPAQQPEVPQPRPPEHRPPEHRRREPAPSAPASGARRVPSRPQPASPTAREPAKFETESRAASVPVRPASRPEEQRTEHMRPEVNRPEMQRSEINRPVPNAPAPRPSQLASTSFGGINVAAARNPRSSQVEALRKVVSRLLLSKRGEKLDPLAICSVASGDGRSFVASNLAVLFAQAGKRTLLIDADFRHADQHNLFKRQAGPGLAELLLGESDWDAIRPIEEIPGLFLLPFGSHFGDPLELLASEDFAQVFAKLANICDIVLVDTPAGEEYVDAQAIAAQVGSALLVIDCNNTSVSAAREVNDALARVGVNLLGAVINRG